MPRRLALIEDTAPSRKSEVTREAILVSAARVFREQGYSGAKLADIAAGADMKAGSLYYHFDSREALVEAVMQRGVETTHRAVLAGLAGLPKSASALDRLTLAIRTHLLLLLQQEDIASATIKLIWQVPQGVRERVLAQQRAYGAVWKTLLREARSAGVIRADLDLSIVRMGIMGALNWTADWYRPARMTPDQIARDMTEMVIGGLAK